MSRCSPSSTSSRATSPTVRAIKSCASRFLICARLRTQIKAFSDWDRIKSPSEDKIVPYAKLRSGSPQNLNKLAVLKVNGGLGTSMGASSAFRATFPI